MDRATFAALLAAGAAGVPLAAFARRLEGSVTTQQTLFASLPRIEPGSWTRIILGSGAEYQKQVGAGFERDPNGKRLLYFETQIGSPGGSCNPSSMRKSYLRAGRFGSLLDTYPLLVSIGRTENFIYRFGDTTDGSHVARTDTTLRLFDEAYLYDTRPIRIVSVAPQTIHAASRNVDATHVVAEFTASSANSKQRLRRVQLWHHPAFPFGVVRYHATLDGLEPFSAHVYAFGGRFHSLLDLPLARARDMTRDGQYGQLPMSVGS